MNVMHNTSKKNAVMYALVVIVMMMFLFYFLTIFQNLKNELKSADSQVVQKQSELTSLKNEASKAKVRESEYESAKSLMASMVTVFYGEKEREESVLYEIGQIFNEAQINPLTLSFADGELRMDNKDMVNLLPQSEETSAETTTAAPSEADTVMTEKMVTMNTTAAATETMEEMEITGRVYDIQVTFRTGFAQLKNLISLIQDRTKHIIISGLQIPRVIGVPPNGAEIVEYEIDEAGVPNDVDRILKLFEAKNKASDAAQVAEQIMVFQVSMTLKYLKPDFVQTYVDIPGPTVPEDQTVETRAEDPEELNPYMPVPWYDDRNDEVMESLKKDKTRR